MQLRCRKPTVGRHGGFTLLEVVASVAILTAASLTLGWAIASGQANAIDSRERIDASLALDQTLGGTVVAAGYGNLNYLPLWVPTSAGKCWITVGPAVTHSVAGELVMGKLVELQIETEDGRIVAQLDYFYHAP